MPIGWVVYLGVREQALSNFPALSFGEKSKRKRNRCFDTQVLAAVGNSLVYLTTKSKSSVDQYQLQSITVTLKYLTITASTLCLVVSVLSIILLYCSILEHFKCRLILFWQRCCTFPFRQTRTRQCLYNHCSIWDYIFWQNVSPVMLVSKSNTCKEKKKGGDLKK